MRLRSFFFSVLIMLFGGTAAHGQDAGAGDYRLSLRMVLDGRIIGTPVLIVRPGEPARVSVDRDGGYSLLISVAPMSAAPAGRVEVASDVYTRSDGHWTLLARPTILMNVGTTASFELSPTAASGRPAFRMEVALAQGP